MDRSFDQPPSLDQENESRSYAGNLGQHDLSAATSNDGLFIFDQHAQTCRGPNNNSSPTFMDFSSNFFDDPITSPATNLSPFTPIDEDFQIVDQERVHLELSKNDSAQSHDSLDREYGTCLHRCLSC